VEGGVEGRKVNDRQKMGANHSQSKRGKGRQRNGDKIEGGSKGKGCMEKLREQSRGKQGKSWRNLDRQRDTDIKDGETGAVWIEECKLKFIPL